MKEIFDDFTGDLAKAFPSYRRREGQVKLAQAVDEVFTNSETGSASSANILLAEGPCGSGKGYAYLIPAILHATKTNNSVLVVTANKALQDQLNEKDLPLLAKALEERLAPKTFKFKLLKGRSNYLCQRELNIYSTRSLNWPNGLEDEGDAITAWASVTPCSGDRSDAPMGVSDKAWRAVSVSGDECDHSACINYKTCHAEAAVKESQVAQIVIVNYDLFYLKLLHGHERFWDRFGYVILDEAHEAASIARNCFGVEISEWNIRRLATLLNDRLSEKELAKRLRAAVAPLFEEIAQYADRKKLNGKRLNDPDFVDITNICEVLDTITRVAAGSCGRCLEGDAGCLACSARTRVREKSKAFSKDLKAFVEQTDDSTAYWIDKPMNDRTTGSSIKLCAAPYHVGEKLQQMVFKKFSSIICMSATMTSGGTFDFIKGELGFTSANSSKVKTIKVESPFDFSKQAKFVIPIGIPFPTSDNEKLFDDAACKAMETIINDCKGRTLGLFTSWRRLRCISEYLRDRVKYPLLTQGDAPNKILAQMFRDQKDSVLLATRSFWMGLDVQGEALSCLVIDKLPFDSFDDPFVDMMKEKHPKTFFENFYVPRATIALAQGAGRLIRSVDDRGVFVLLDQRVKTKNYGKAVLNSLPFKGYSQDIADAGRFLNLK